MTLRRDEAPRKGFLALLGPAGPAGRRNRAGKETRSAAGIRDHQEENLLRPEGAMHATIRRYTPKTGTVDKKTLDDLKHRIEDGFVPIIQDVRGFHCYYAVNVGDKELVTISIFEDKTGAAESTRRAADFVKKDPLKDQLGSPEIFEGNLLVSKEAAVATR
jgi:hypothetical protein